MEIQDEPLHKQCLELWKEEYEAELTPEQQEAELHLQRKIDQNHIQKERDKIKEKLKTEIPRDFHPISSVTGFQT